MCGINGFTGNSPEILEQMNTALSHRGPDFAGTFFDGNVSLGHTLLSIRESTDLSKQPVQQEKSPWVLLFNGQLYNSKQMKEDLGATFHAVDLDTTLLFGMIEKYGWNFIERIHGMFAIALYNREEKVLRLYRDPSGQKLLYYYYDDKSFVFSSEIQSILTHPHIERGLDEETVLLATSLGFVPGDKTLFENIKKVNLSESVAFDLAARKLWKQYFKSNSSAYYSTEGEGVFENLIAEHLQSKQKVALNLSGGLDSSLLLHEMSRVGHEMNTYTTYFEAGGDSESYNRDALLARRLAKEYGSKHNEITVTKETFYKNFKESYLLIEEPNYNISLPTYLQTAKTEGVSGDKNRVILSGDGGDEVFGGYSYYLQSARIQKHIKLLTPFVFNKIKNFRNNTNLDFANPSDRWLFFRDFYFKALLKETPSFVKKYCQKTAKEFETPYKLKNGPVYDMMFLDRLFWMGGENFIRSDKLYMSQSLEMRSPLSFHPFRMHFDTVLKESDYITKESNKLYLRNLFFGKLPGYITKRPDKTGWRAPIAYWYDKRFKDLFLSIIAEVEGQQGVVDWKAVKRIIERTDKWPGKYVHIYLSLALLSKRFDLII